MLGRKECQLELFITGALRQLVPDDHILVRVDQVLDLSWLRDEVADLCCTDNGRPGIDPEVAVRLPAFCWESFMTDGCYARRRSISQSVGSWATVCMRCYPTTRR
jgi:hypothetical protein